jgi:hypothetical protein
MSGLEAGVARATITPPMGTYLIGYGDRTSGCNTIHDDLTGTALVLDDGATRLALIALDMLCLNEHVVERIRTRLAAEGRFSPENVTISGPHTHAGPIAYADARSRRRRRRVIDSLVEKAVSVTRDAEHKRERVSAFWGRGEAHVAVNRREKGPDGKIVLGENPDGPVDRSLQLLQLRSESGRPVVTLVNFACHGTVLGPKNRGVSADWPGVMRREVEAATDGPCMFLQGATGDLNPAHEWGDDDLAAVDRLGRAVAESALPILANGMSSLSAVPLRAAREQVWLPTVPRLDSDGRVLGYKQIVKQLAGVPRFLADRVLNARYPWKTISRQGENGYPELSLELQALRAGECAILGHAAETFNEVGQAIKLGSPTSRTLFAGYTNGCIGYIPTAQAHAEGGYEVEEAPVAYRMSGLFDPGCAEEVTRRSVALLHRICD